MRDLLSWSVPLGRISGIAVKVHILFLVVAIGLILRVGLQKGAPNGVWLETTFVVGLLFVCVLLHELGHCVAARLVDGEAHEILLWPLGGLALVDVPHTPRANFIAAAAGPASGHTERASRSRCRECAERAGCRDRPEYCDHAERA